MGRARGARTTQRDTLGRQNPQDALCRGLWWIVAGLWQDCVGISHVSAVSALRRARGTPTTRGETLGRQRPAGRAAQRSLADCGRTVGVLASIGPRARHPDHTARGFFSARDSGAPKTLRMGCAGASGGLWQDCGGISHVSAVSALRRARGARTSRGETLGRQRPSGRAALRPLADCGRVVAGLWPY